MSHAVAFIYSPAPRCVSVEVCPNTQLPTHVVLIKLILKTLRSSHFQAYKRLLDNELYMSPSTSHMPSPLHLLNPPSSHP